MTGHAVERALPLGVTGDAPAHRQGRDLGDPLHPLDGAVAGLTGKTDLEVRLVGELDEAGNLVNPAQGMGRFSFQAWWSFWTSGFPWAATSLWQPMQRWTDGRPA